MFELFKKILITALDKTKVSKQINVWLNFETFFVKTLKFYNSDLKKCQVYKNDNIKIVFDMLISHNFILLLQLKNNV